MADPVDQFEHPPVPDDGLAADVATVRMQLSVSQNTIEELTQALDAAGVRERQLEYELKHRVRNMLAVIRSVYRRSLENGASREEFAEHFEGRLNALARYQAISDLEEAGIDLEDIVRDELLQVHCQDGPNLSIVGPPVRLRAKSAEVMGLAIHELTTNAIKFGALYQPGKLTVEWSLSEVQGQTTLHFRWKEEGAPPLAIAPRPRGFGQQFIEEALPYQLGATTSFELKPSGIDCSIVLPMPDTDHGTGDDPAFENATFLQPHSEQDR